MSLLCSGRVAIVTGAGRGIGREHALALAAHGAKVVVNDLGTSNDGVGSDETPAQEVVRTIKERGGEAVVNTDNVADFRGAKRMIDQAIDTYGTLDVLVNNAGIINTSSISGLFGNTGQSNYGAAKAGIAALTIIAARELKRYGVTVNAVAPQALTRMTEGLRERTEEQKAAMHPGRVSPAIVWMASVQSADFTGRIIEAGSGLLSIAEGWHRGPTIEPEEDPSKLGPILLDLQARARKNAGMDGEDLD
jgi:NAD(P)-dependent dehydrogenase (short-subunit alcohol dehydrogenase family)